MAPSIGNLPTVLYDTILMNGAWNLSTPTLELAPGVLRDVQNFEVDTSDAGGYSRIAGYERFDGRPSPTDAIFEMLQLVAFASTPAVGNTVTGVTSAATGVVILVTASYLLVTKVVGTFLNTEDINVGATLVGTLTPLDVVLSPKLFAQYTQLAADHYRADIGAVPGSGPVRGVVGAIFGGVDNVYAFRNNAGGTAQAIYKSSAAGWVLVPYMEEISFTNGGAGVPADGVTLTQGAVTATIKRVVLQTGSFPSSVNTGRFIIDARAGGNFGAGAATAGAVAVTLSGIQTAISPSPGGTFEFEVGNFSGQSLTNRIYGCDGVNRGFEFDGETYVPITTGSSPDVPTHVNVHAKHLFFAFGSSAIHSGPGFPYKWTAADGASELPCGDTLTNFLEQPGSTTSAALGITTRTDTLMLYGTTVANWNLVSFNNGIGAIPFTAKLLNESYWLAPHGVVSLRATLNYGNFKSATITHNITSYIETQRALVAYAAVNRTKNQYRILFTDKSALSITIKNGTVAGITKFLHTDAMFCAWNSTRVTLQERLFYGATTTGYVYQADRGSSFDGAAIDAFLLFNWNAIRTPRIIKHFGRASVEMQGENFAEFAFGYQLGYGSAGVSQGDSQTIDSGLTAAAQWDSSVWDTFLWDSVSLVPAEVKLKGNGVNIQPSILVGTNYIHPFTLNSMIIHYRHRRPLR